MAIIIKSDVWKIPKILEGVTDAIMKKAAVRAANRTAEGMHTQAARSLSKYYKLPYGGSSSGGGGLVPPGTKGMFEVIKATAQGATSPDKIYALVSASTKPISRIHVIRGSKLPENQKGIPIRARRKLKGTLYDGKTIVLRREFIAKGKNNNMQVFRRSRKTNKMEKRSVPSAAKVFNKGYMRDPVTMYGIDRFGKEYESAVSYYLSKVKEPASK